MNDTPLIAPAVDALVVAHLNAAITPPVSTKVPDPRPATFVRAIVTGGAGRVSTAVHESQITVESWAATYAAASQLAREVEAHMLVAPYGGSAIRLVQSFGAPVELPAPSTTQYRFTATYLVSARVSAL